MLVGGCHMVFQIGYWNSLWLNSILMFIFLLVSSFAEKKYHLLVAKALSVIYAILMLVIMVFIVIEAVRLRHECSFPPPTVSLLLVVSAYLLAGLLHLEEFWNLRLLILPGAIYYLTVPSMYMLLPFYCLFNLNNVSWETRETQDLSKGNSLSCFCCFLPHVEQETKQIEREPDVSIDRWKDDIKKRIRNEIKEEQESKTEKAIWEEIIKELSPLDKSEEEKKQMQPKLDILRTKSLLFCLFVNLAFVLIVFLLQIRFEEFNRFSLNWPLCEISMFLLHDLTPNDTIPTAPSFLFDDYIIHSSQEITEEDVRYFTLDPINLVFIAFFLGVMLFQVVGMFVHRLRTVGHLLSRTKWGVPDEKKNPINKDSIDSKRRVPNTSAKDPMPGISHSVNIEEITAVDEEIHSGGLNTEQKQQ